MKIKHSYEIFGLPGSGKTFIRNKIKKKIENEGYKVLNTKEITTNYLGLCYKTSIFDKICLKYFSLSIKINNQKKNFQKNIKKITKKKNLINNIISNIIRNNYYNLCKKFVKQNDNNSIFLNIVEKNFYIYEKKIYLEWFYELLAATIIFNKLISHKKKIYFFPDEAFIQKLYILGKLKDINKKKIIKSYLDNMPLLNNIIYLKSNIYQIKKINNFRKKYQIQKYQKKEHIKGYYLIENEILKYKKKIKFKTKINRI